MRTKLTEIFRSKLAYSIHSNRGFSSTCIPYFANILKNGLYFTACSESHGIGNDFLPVVSSSASSSRPSHEPEKARLLSHTGSWCASQETRDEILQLDFGETMMLTGIATQGHHSNNECVSKYRLDYSVDGADWFTYTQSFGNPGNKRVELAANTDCSSVFKNKFLYEVNARFLKIVVKDWYSAICLRVQVFGYKGKLDLILKYAVGLALLGHFLEF